jgi:hypothetical protein
MRQFTRHTVFLGFSALCSLSAWGAGGDLDVTIRVIERHERLEDLRPHRIELPRENAAAARERFTANWQEENAARFREAGDHGEADGFERPRGEHERRIQPERLREWSRERDQGREDWRREERRPSVAGERQRH